MHDNYAMLRRRATTSGKPRQDGELGASYRMEGD
jgi:hypothetical protein